MSAQDKITAKFDQLLTEGSQVLATHGWDGSTFRNGFPPNEIYWRFRAEILNIIRRVCGENSDHYLELERIAKQQHAGHPTCLPAFLGVLNAAYRDYQGGLLFDLRSLIAAELLGDFVGQAEYLLSEGYYAPAASLAGAVLEDSLRKLCDLHGIAYPQKTSINQLNVDLARAQIYNALVQKQITAFADLRNKADHGKFDEFKTADVQDMLQRVRRFATDYLR